LALQIVTQISAQTINFFLLRKISDLGFAACVGFAEWLCLSVGLPLLDWAAPLVTRPSLSDTANRGRSPFERGANGKAQPFREANTGGKAVSLKPYCSVQLIERRIYLNSRSQFMIEEDSG